MSHRLRMNLSLWSSLGGRQIILVVNTMSTKRSMEDERVMEFLDETTRRMDGRYEVGLIWKNPFKDSSI